MAIIKRLVKGTALTHVELDGNFTDLDGRVTTLETADTTKSQVTSSSIGALSDVDTTGVTANSILKYNASTSKFEISSDATGGGGGGINNLVEDTTPQLGGVLDANGQNIDMGINFISDAKVGQWDTAYSWGDHSLAGYVTSTATELVTDTSPQLGGTLDAQGNDIDMGTNVLTDTNLGQFITAYGWGDHSLAGYLTSATTELVTDTTPQLGGDLDTNSNNINFSGTDKAQFGAAQDLGIWHNGSHSIIRETGTGSLYLQSDNNVILSTDSGTKKMVKGVGSGEVILYHNDVDKLWTSTSGVTVVDEVHTEGATPHLTLKRTDNANVPTLRFKGSGGVIGASIDFDGTAGTSNELAFQIYDGATIAERFRVTYTGTKVTGSIDATQIVTTGTNQDFTIEPNGTGDILLKTDGQVGIGTVSSPDTKLHLKSESSIITLQRTQDANKPGIDWQNSNGNVRAVLRMDGTSGTSNEIYVETYDGATQAERFRVTHTGVTVTGTLNTHTIPGGTGTLALTSDIPAAYTNASVDTHLNQSNPTSGHVLSWNGADYAWVSNAGGGGIALTDLSVGAEGTASGDGAIAYDDSTGIFTYTPPVIPADLGDLTDTGNLLGSSNSISQLNTNVTVTDTGTDGKITFDTDGTDRWAFTSGGHLIPESNASYDIGNAEYKVRHLFLSDNSLKFVDNSDTEYTLGVSSGKLQYQSKDVIISSSTANQLIDVSGASLGISIGTASTSGSTISIGAEVNDTSVNMNGVTEFGAKAIFNRGVHEKFLTITGATGVIAHNVQSGHVFLHTTPASDWTANFTNLVLAQEDATNIAIVIDQGNSAYMPTAVQIDGVAQTIVWQGNNTPTGTDNGKNVVSFTILNDGGTYIVLGQSTSFGGV